MSGKYVYISALYKAFLKTGATVPHVPERGMNTGLFQWHCICHRVTQVPQQKGAYKNDKGEYDTDFLEIIAYDSIAENTKQYVKVGNILGAKGKIEKLSQDTPTKLVGEKITFLSTGKKSEESE